MSSINWPEILAIFVGFASFFIYLMHRLDSNKKETNDAIRELDAKIELKTDNLQKSISSIASKISNIEGQITQMTRPEIIPIKKYQQQYTEPPEEENPPKKAQNQ